MQFNRRCCLHFYANIYILFMKLWIYPLIKIIFINNALQNSWSCLFYYATSCSVLKTLIIYCHVYLVLVNSDTIFRQQCQVSMETKLACYLHFHFIVIDKSLLLLYILFENSVNRGWCIIIWSDEFYGYELCSGAFNILYVSTSRIRSKSKQV